MFCFRCWHEPRTPCSVWMETSRGGACRPLMFGPPLPSSKFWLVQVLKPKGILEKNSFFHLSIYPSSKLGFTGAMVLKMLNVDFGFVIIRRKVGSLCHLAFSHLFAPPGTGKTPGAGWNAYVKEAELCCQNLEGSRYDWVVQIPWLHLS